MDRSRHRNLAAVVSVAVMAAGGVTAAAPADASSDASAPVTTAKRHKLRQQARLHLPKTLKRSGRTLILRRKARTSAQRRLTLTVVASTPKGRRAAVDDVSVIHRPDRRAYVWLSGRSRLRVKVVVEAAATSRYRAFRKVRVYRTKRDPMAPVRQSDMPSAIKGPAKDFTKLFSWLIEAVAGEAVGSVYGWAIGGIFGGNNNEVDLRPIMQQLEQIKAQLNVISAKIDELRREVDFNACQAQTTAAARAVAVIQDANDQLANMVKAKEYRPSVLTPWADQVLAVGGLGASLKEIHNVLAGMAGPAGSLGACGKAYRNDWKVPLDEDGYYGRLWAYENYFMATQLLGANMMVEAAHYKAVQELKQSGKPVPKPKDITAVCKGNVDTYCKRALQVTRDVYFNIVQQAVQSGAAFAWKDNPDDKSVMALQKGTPYVWMLDLNAYQRQKQCEISSVPDRPCGATVGIAGLPDDQQRYAGYRWRAANANQWADLLDTRENGDRRISEIMEKVGFTRGRANKLIVYTGEMMPSSFDNPFMVWQGGRDRQTKLPLRQWDRSRPHGACLLDTNFIAHKSWLRWPICAGGGNFFDALLNEYGKDGSTYSYTTSRFADDFGSNRTFYVGRLVGDIHRAEFWKSMDIAKAPGWLSSDGGGYRYKPQYHWPVMEVSDNAGYACTALQIGDRKFPTAKTNAGGAYSMCSADFATWLQTWLPKPPPAP